MNGAPVKSDPREKAIKTRNSFTIYDLRFTIYDLRFTVWKVNRLRRGVAERRRQLRYKIAQKKFDSQS